MNINQNKISVSNYNNIKSLSIQPKKQNKKISFKGLVNPNEIKLLRLKGIIDPELRSRVVESVDGWNALYKALPNVNVKAISNHFEKKLGISVDFKNNPIVAGISGLTANIFQRLGWKNPTGVYVHDLSNLKNPIAICNTYVDKPVEKWQKQVFGRTFPMRSVVFNERVNWDNIQRQVIDGKLAEHFSTGHFLHPPIHEWVHNAHADHIFTKWGFPGPNNLGYKQVVSHKGIPAMNILVNHVDHVLEKFGIDLVSDVTRMDMLGNMGIDTKRQKFVRKKVSGYGAEVKDIYGRVIPGRINLAETIAEDVTARIVKSLDRKTIMPKYDPFIYAKFQEPKTFAQLIENAWDGIAKV